MLNIVTADVKLIKINVAIYAEINEKTKKRGGQKMDKSIIKRQCVCMKEAAEILGVDVKTMKKILENNSNSIAYKRIGRKILVSVDSLNKYLNANVQ